MPEIDEEGHSIVYREFGIVPAASHPIPSPDRNYAPKRIASTRLRNLGFRFITVLCTWYATPNDMAISDEMIFEKR